MAKVHLIGHRRRLDVTLDAVHRLGVLHLVDVHEDPSVRLPPLAVDETRLHEMEDLRYLRARLDGLLGLAPELPLPDTYVDVDLDAIREELASAGPRLETMARRLDGLEAEAETLPQHLDSLRRLLPLLPELTQLEGYDTDAVIIDARHAGVLGELNARLAEMLGGNYEVISDQLDPATVGAVVVFPKRNRAEVEALFGGQQVNRLRLPRRFESVPFRQAITAMERRLEEIPVEVATVREAIGDELRSHPSWPAAARRLTRRLEQLGAIRHLGATPHVFVICGWVPVDEIDLLRSTMAAEVGGEVLVELAPIGEDEEPPVQMANPAVARPFQSLVALLSLPRYGSLDPTTLMALFLPLFFGMMLGDVVYGAILLVVALVLRSKLRGRSPFLADLSRIFVLSAGWSIVWGIVYGEALGDLGHRWLGMEPLWINREEALQPLLLFAVAVGAAHVTLGLVLGVFEARRRADRHALSQRLAMLVALVGLFVLTGILAGRLPDGLMTPAVAAMVVGLVVLVGIEGPMGVLMGPLEMMGTIGNVLSYLRIAAIGLASVYLARVANELGATGPLWLGIIIATLFHALNLVLGAFSPTIQALRLHYVEFFGKFYEAGGRPFEPFGGDDTAPSRHPAATPR